ncbi:UNVERIFIED_CONTAM: hypothetical protein Scaly_2624800 [Sesamum calycinum]|uniref:Gag-asp_proteas domain-containing protein n=1 Tax=Sesamum calycinum TaxID=2727403 RepID=A0AAW2JDS0_9LAMI
MELRRQGIKDLSSAIAAADCLVDFRVSSSSDQEKKKKDSGKEKGKSGKVWKDGKFKKKKNLEVTGLGNKETAQPNIDKIKKGYYLCNGDHRIRDCPKGEKLNALVAEEDDDEGGSTRVQISGKTVMPMLDTGATHNFVADREIQKLGLTLAQHSSRIKAANSEAKPIQDDFDVILRVDFMLLANAMDSIRSAEKKDNLMLTMQVKAGLSCGEQTYLAALIEIKSNVVQEVLDEVAELLQEFKDVFPPELPKKLPPRRAIDHAIELEPGARPPA